MVSRRHAALLIGGQALGQVGILLALPVITRFYSPVEVGQFQIANAVALILQPLATWRLEFVIPTTHSVDGARRLLRRGLMITSIMSVSLLALGLGAMWAGLTIAHIMIMVSLLLFAYSMLALDNAVLIREHASARLSARNLVSGILGGALQVCASLLLLPVASLAVSVLIARVIAVFSTRGRRGVANSRSANGAERLGEDHEYTWRRSVPTVLSGVISNATVNAVPVIMPVAGSTAAAGYAGAAQRIAAAPASFVAQAVGQIVQGRIAPLVRARRPLLRHEVARTFRVLALPAAGMTVALALGGVFLAEPILGPGWAPAGVMLAILALPFSLQLIVAPVNPVLVMIRREKVLLRLQVARLVVAVVGALLVAILTNDPYATVIYFSAATTATYFVAIAAIIKLAGAEDEAYRGDNDRT